MHAMHLYDQRNKPERHGAFVYVQLHDKIFLFVSSAVSRNKSEVRSARDKDNSILKKMSSK